MGHVRSIAAAEARDHLDDRLEAVAQGEEVAIMRDGRVIARLIGCPSKQAGSRALEGVERMIATRAGTTLGGVATIKDLIEDGRR